MSNRRHLWKGIHDKEWVQGGVQFKAQLQEPRPRAGQSVTVSVEVINSAVGHKFSNLHDSENLRTCCAFGQPGQNITWESARTHYWLGRALRRWRMEGIF